MITNKHERKICEKYSAYDEHGKVHCSECPLRKGDFRQYDFRCKANSHYNRKTQEWKFDDMDSYEYAEDCPNYVKENENG